MDGGLGEVLIHPGQISDVLTGSPWEGVGLPSLVVIVIPEDPTLVGLDVYLQGLFIDTTLGATVRNALTSALYVQVGL